MHQTVNPLSRNLLLRGMSSEDLRLIAPDLESIELERRFVLKRRRAPIDHVYFPTSGIASSVAYAGRDRRLEVGLFGWDGMSGGEVVMGDNRAVHECFVQIAGYGHRISSESLREAMDVSPTLRLFLLRFVLSQQVQTEHTALANAQAQLEERLCRWLLMCHDRVDGDVLELTHEFISTMLGVRRAGVTLAIHMLEGRGLIQAERGRIRVVDREGLEAGAGGIYGKPEAEFERLVGVSLSRSTP